MDGSKKNRTKAANQARASAMKRDGIERTTGRCCICGKVYTADMLGRGYTAHRCHADGK
jgi:hypothetical protein